MKSPLLKSRKFLIMIVNVVVSVTTYFVTKYVNPDAAKDVLFLIGSLQPVVLAVIASIAVQNVEHIKQNSIIEREKNWVEADLAAANAKEEVPQ